MISPTPYSIKELSLEDKQYEIDSRLEELSTLQGTIWLDNDYITTCTYHCDEGMTEAQERQYEQLIEEKLDVVCERDQLVQQVEEDRLK